jgi:hypothetical protein
MCFQSIKRYGRDVSRRTKQSMGFASQRNEHRYRVRRSLCDLMQSTLTQIFICKKEKRHANQIQSAGFVSAVARLSSLVHRKVLCPDDHESSASQTSVQVPAAANGPHLSNGKTEDGENRNRGVAGLCMVGWMPLRISLGIVALELHVKMT